MNYKHIYHAGHFADVMKHVVMLSLFDSLKQKASPFCYIDTHAGSGIYDLTSDKAKKTNEFKEGIEKIWQAKSPPSLIKSYLASITAINQQFSAPPADTLHFYPGSPLFAKTQMRPQDRAVLCELENGEYASLKNLFAGDKQVAVHNQDGLLGLKAFLPPKEKRGLILIDSPFENPDEFSDLMKALTVALDRFANGVYAIWYPIKMKTTGKRFHYDLKSRVDGEILLVELSIYPERPDTLTGSGMAIINPPWKLKDVLQDTLSWIWKTLTINDQGGVSVSYLK